MANVTSSSLERHLQTLGRDAAFLDGVFSAVAVAPAAVPPARWLELLTPADGFDTASQARSLVAVAMKRHNAVVEALEKARPHLPPADGDEETRSFARGFVEGALMCPQWQSSVPHVEILARFAFHAGRADLVPERLREHVVTHAGATFRADLPRLLVAAHQATGMRAVAPRLEANVPKVGRNDACPCGSGKKSKHCCGKA